MVARVPPTPPARPLPVFSLGQGKPPKARKRARVVAMFAFISGFGDVCCRWRFRYANVGCARADPRSCLLFAALGCKLVVPARPWFGSVLRFCCYASRPILCTPPLFLSPYSASLSLALLTRRNTCTTCCPPLQHETAVAEQFRGDRLPKPQRRGVRGGGVPAPQYELRRERIPTW